MSKLASLKSRTEEHSFKRVEARLKTMASRLFEPSGRWADMHGCEAWGFAS